MRTAIVLPLLSLGLLGLAACGDRERPAEAAPAPAAAAWAPPATVGNGVVSAQVLWIDRDRDRVSARLRLENLSAAPVQLRNLGDTLTGFRCAVEGRSYSADATRRDGPATAATLAELPAETPVELDLRWRLNPLRSDAYDCTITVGNLVQDGKKLPDLTVPVPGPVREDARAREREKPVEPSGKKTDVSL
jgi:hypothetical protein